MNDTDIVDNTTQKLTQKTEMTEFQKELLKKIQLNSIDVKETNTLLVTITVPCTNAELGAVDSSLKEIFPEKEIVVMGCVQLKAHED